MGIPKKTLLENFIKAVRRSTRRIFAAEKIYLGDFEFKEHIKVIVIPILIGQPKIE